MVESASVVASGRNWSIKGQMAAGPLRQRRAMPVVRYRKSRRVGSDVVSVSLTVGTILCAYSVRDTH